jgi:hypothetical protein
MTPSEYIAIMRATHALQLAQLHYESLIRAAGLDPMRPCTYDDRALTITQADLPLASVPAKE